MSYLMKDPHALLDYSIDWASDYLGDDRISESRWFVVPAGPGAIEVVEDQFDSGRSQATVIGGLEGRIYRLTNEIVTASGIRDRRSVTLRVEKR